jgi:aspartate racemase
MIGANTMHHIADNVQAVINIPLIHIADAVATEIKTKKLKTVALLGTKYTMQLDFYNNKLLSHGISTIIPSDTDIEFINNSIYTEFSKGIFLPETKKEYLLIIDKMEDLGAEAVILGCTEIPILIKQIDSELPLFDSAYLHSRAAVEFVLHD